MNESTLYPLIFFHIPKNAGVSIRRILEIDTKMHPFNFSRTTNLGIDIKKYTDPVLVFRVVASSRNHPHVALPTLRQFLSLLLTEILKPNQYKLYRILQFFSVKFLYNSKLFNSNKYNPGDKTMV